MADKEVTQEELQAWLNEAAQSPLVWDLSDFVQSSKNRLYEADSLINRETIGDFREILRQHFSALVKLLSLLQLFE
jgi:hypothetical protein